jgi:hypothetical protein
VLSPGSGSDVGLDTVATVVVDEGADWATLTFTRITGAEDPAESEPERVQVTVEPDREHDQLDADVLEYVTPLPSWMVARNGPAAVLGPSLRTVSWMLPDRPRRRADAASVPVRSAPTGAGSVTLATSLAVLLAVAGSAGDPDTDAVAVDELAAVVATWVTTDTDELPPAASAVERPQVTTRPEAEHVHPLPEEEV